MSRTSIVNGHSTESVRPKGGYDAFFASADPVEPAATHELSGGVVASAQPQHEPPAPQPPMSQPPASTQGASHDGPPGSGAVTPRTDAGPQAPRWTPEASAQWSQQASTPSAGSVHSAQSPSAAQPVPPAQHTQPPQAQSAPLPQQSQSAQSVPATNAVPAAEAQYTERHAEAQYTPFTPGGSVVPVSAHSEASTRVPDRVDHSAYESLPRIEVLPAALSSSDLLADIAAAKRAQLRSTTGMRGALNKVGFNLGLSPAEQRTEERRGRIRRQLTSTYQIAVVSVKGGVGRTTTAATLGSTFAGLRPDRVVAIDANPDFGDLSTRTSRHPYGLTLRDLAQASNIDAFSAVQSFTSINDSDLAVVASPWTTEATEALSGPEYNTAVEVLRRHYNLLLVDCGTGVLDSATGTVLQTSDAVVVVTPATVGGVTGAVATLNWLSSHGLQHLAATSIVAIVHHQPNKPTVEVGAIEKLFATAQRPTCLLPYDAHLAEGGEIDLRLLDSDTVLAFEELAAGLADNFPAYLTGGAGDRGWR
ncbi:AAA family ATPase [Nocardia sp. NPDC050710]|uniref:AAA family ATPase n=1 Tax=Nocardia sp. NPDC050710 TaxID=3157220 RepID=UPI0033C80659